MTKSLYQDFTVTEDNCDDQPVHRPLAIAGNGHLLAFEIDTWTLLATSQGSAELFGLTTDKLWVEPVQAWLPDQLLNKLQSSEVIQKIPVPVIEYSGQHFDAIVHHQDGIAFLELEERTQEDANTIELLKLNSQFSQCNNEESLSESACRFIQDV